MPVTATGSEAGISVDRADVQISVPVDGDPRNAASVNTPLQKLADYLQRVRKKAGFLDLASTWAALQTFTHRIVVSRQGGDVNPALSVTGGISTDTLAVGADGAGWVTLTLSGDWTAQDAESTPRYRVDSFGRVWMRGAAVSASGTGPIAVLPAPIQPATGVRQFLVVNAENNAYAALLRVLPITDTFPGQIVAETPPFLGEPTPESVKRVSFDQIVYYP